MSWFTVLGFAAICCLPLLVPDLIGWVRKTRLSPRPRRTRGETVRPRACTLARLIGEGIRAGWEAQDVRRWK